MKGCKVFFYCEFVFGLYWYRILCEFLLVKYVLLLIWEEYVWMYLFKILVMLNWMVKIVMCLIYFILVFILLFNGFNVLNWFFV